MGNPFRLLALVVAALLIAIFGWVVPSMSPDGAASDERGRRGGGQGRADHGTRPSAPGDEVDAPSEQGTVVRIVDGDTVVLSGSGSLLSPAGTTVRLLEVDAPESVRPGYPVECWGPESSAELASLLPVGSPVTVRPDLDLIDPYGRTLLYVWNAEAAFVNLELVRSGAAEAVLYEPNDRHIDQLERAETAARAGGQGMWGRCG